MAVERAVAEAVLAATHAHRTADPNVFKAVAAKRVYGTLKTLKREHKEKHGAPAPAEDRPAPSRPERPAIDPDEHLSR